MLQDDPRLLVNSMVCHEPDGIDLDKTGHCLF